MNKFLIPLLTGVMVAIIICAGCAKPAPAPAPAPTALVPSDQIAVGLSTAMSGPYAGFGEKVATGFKIAVDEINELGGIKSKGGAKLRFVLADDGASPDQCVAEVERLITLEKCVTVTGVWPTSMAGSDVCERHSVPYVNALSIAPLTERGYQYTFRTISTGWDEAGQNVGALIELSDELGIPRPKTCFMEYISDDCSVTEAEAFKPQAEAAGIEIIGEEIVTPYESTYVPLLIKVETAQPDFLFSCHMTPGAIVLYREIMEREIYFPYGISSWGGGTEDPFFYESLPLKAYEYGFVQDNGDSVPQMRPWYDHISSKVEAHIGRPWIDAHQVCTYSTAWIIKDALERAAPSDDLATFRINVRDALRATDITRENCPDEMILPDGTKFCPQLDPQLFARMSFDETGQNPDGGGLISQNLGGIRWPMYPYKYRVPDQPGPVLPMPPWDERG